MEKYHKTDIAPVEQENERDETYQASNPQIDPTRTDGNYHIVKRQRSYTQFINDKIEALDLPTKVRKLDFLCLVEKYSSIEELTPEIIRSFVDRIIVHEKRKENGHYRQEVEIVYNFIGAVEIPDFLNNDYDGLSC